MKRPEHQNQREAGQSMVVVALMIVIILAMAGLTIDVGRLYLTRQELQTNTDAATLAGARLLPYGSENETTLKRKIDDGVQRALQTYAQNVGLDISSLPEPPYSYSPAWDPDGENLVYSYDMVYERGGKAETDHVSITVLYHDELTEERDLPKERCILVEATRDVPMIFGGLLGPPQATAHRPGGAFRGVFEVKWKFYTRADVHGTPAYWVDRDGIEKVYTVSKDGYVYALDAWGDEGVGRTFAYWKFKVLGSAPWGERYLCYPYTSKYHCEPLGQSEYNANYAVISSPLVMPSPDGARDLVIFASYPLHDDGNRGRLYALDSMTGELIWTSYVGQREYHLGAYGSTYIDAAPAFSPDGTVVYYASRDGRIYAFNVLDGSDVWPDCEPGDPLVNSCAKVSGGTNSTPAVDPSTGMIYIATSKPRDGSGTGSPKSDRGVIFAFNPDGTKAWHWYPGRTGQGFDSSPVLWPPANPTALYIGGRDQRLYKVSTSGNLIWEYHPPSDLVGPDGQHGNPRSAISATPLVVEEEGLPHLYFTTEYGAGFKLRDNGSSVTQVWAVWLGYDIDTTASPPGPGGGSNIRRGIHMSPAIAQDFVYFGIVTEWDIECAFQAVRKSDGHIFQSFVMENDTHSSLRVAPNGWLYYASCDNYTYGVDTNPESLDSRLIR